MEGPEGGADTSSAGGGDIGASGPAGLVRAQANGTAHDDGVGDPGDHGPVPAAGKPNGIRTGRNLPAAIGVGLALGAAVLGTLYTQKALFLLVIGAAVGIGVVEMIRAFGVRDIQVPLKLQLTGLAAMLAGAYWGGPIWLLGAFTITVLIMLCERMFKGVDGYVRDAAGSVLTSVYPSLIAGFVPLMLAKPDGADRVVLFIAVTVSSDIGGYFAGILFGRHKMSIISPKKTWEGFAGSILACVICGSLLMRFLLDGQYWQGAIIGVVAAVCATLGDLVESVIKRDLGIKDMGSLLPGHGGLMDRLDSLLATLVPIWLLLAAFLPG
ncbi:phosphatidate cytidylyltransferase [Sphaerisporangium sp. NPDC051011]|uniref:phosphatidate cytidylyltransferase n=1 Tax=Sphaerisporangium sp. NPDC051011 TaxID=3155792 RepID=UPI0033CAC943